MPNGGFRRGTRRGAQEDTRGLFWGSPYGIPCEKLQGLAQEMLQAIRHGNPGGTSLGSSWRPPRLPRAPSSVIPLGIFGANIHGDRPVGDIL